jgi:hypothetical protein
LTLLLACYPSAAKAVGYDISGICTFRPDEDLETLQFVIYEQVFREDSWKYLREIWVQGDEHSGDGSDDSANDRRR